MYFRPSSVRITAAGFLAASALQLHAGSFTAGNLAVLQADSASGNNTTATIVELSPTATAQTPTNLIAISGTGTSALKISGSATSTGYLADSADGALLSFTGANSTATGNVNAILQRGVGTLDPSGAFSLKTTYTGINGNQTRCATSLNNTTWFIGDQGGLYTNAATAPSPAGNLRGVKSFGSLVYALQQDKVQVVVSTISAATGGTVTGLPGLTFNNSAQDFYLISSGDNDGVFDVLYILSAGTIEKYSLVNNSWVTNGSATTTFGGYGLAAARQGHGGVLYVSTGTGASPANSVLKLVDSAGYNAPLNLGAAATLYTAPAGTTVKGVAFAPAVPPLAAPSFTLEPLSQPLATGATATLTVAASGNPTPTFQWYSGTSPDTSNPISGATSSSYTTPPFTTTASYWARATNSQGTGNSTTAILSPALSGNADLSNLTIGSGTLTPSFTTANSGYTVALPSSTASLTVTPTSVESAATLQVRVNAGSYSTVASGTASSALSLTGGTNVIEVKVTAPNGTTIRTYTISAYRAPLYNGSNRNILEPNTGAWDPAGITLGGTGFINLGLQGVGRVPAATRDPVTGETIGSISDMQVTNFVNHHDGTWGGTFNFLPDPGYGSTPTPQNYPARINAFDFTFTPYTSATPTSAQNQVAMTFAGSTRFTYDHDGNPATPAVFTAGLNPDSKLTLFGTTLPAASGSTSGTDGTVVNRFTIDTESLAFDRRPGKAGSGWLGDEYGASLYHFNSSRQIDGVVQIPAALVPHSPVGTVNFNGTPINGRRDGQGFEGISQSPSGKRLFGLLQSATLQDSASGKAGRSNARMVVYDISSTDTPSAPIAQYVVQLPVVDDTGSTTNGSSVDVTAAQSSIVALSDTQFLIMSRDSNGRGASGAPVFKSILLADLSSATNINGIYDAEGAAVAPAGVLAAGVTPVTWTEALNLLGKLNADTPEIAKFGLNLNTAPGDVNTLSEKWESLALVSVNDPAFPNDYFLFIGNDNDFSTADGSYLDANGVLRTYIAPIDIDMMVLAYRVRLNLPVAPLVTWRQTHFQVTAEDGILANNADYDSDGVENLVEYALGTDPTSGTGVDGTTALPQVVHGDADPLLSDRLSIRFTTPDPNATDITYIVQGSDDLVTWSDIASKAGAGSWTWLAGGTSHIVTSSTGGVSTVKVGDSVPEDASHPKRMMRLKVTNP